MMKEEGGGTKMEGFKMVACRATGFVRSVAGGGTITYEGGIQSIPFTAVSTQHVVLIVFRSRALRN